MENILKWVPIVGTIFTNYQSEKNNYKYLIYQSICTLYYISLMMYFIITN